MASFSLLTLVYIPQTYSWLHLGFYHFLASIITLALSGVFLLIYLYFFLTWGGSSKYEMTTFPSRQTIRTKSIVNNPSPRRHGRPTVHSNIEPPTKDQLHRLKEALGFDVGSLQFKRRGMGIYHVVYNEGKYKWRFIGSWLDLKEKIQD